MADDQLRMQATVVDGFTGPLQSLNKLLTQVGMNPAAKTVTKDWNGVTASLNKVSAEIRTGLQPAFAGIGVASLGISGAIGSATLAIKNFAFSTRDMGLFSKQIGLSVDQLRQLKSVGERFGVDWTTAQGSLKTFAGNMDQLQRRWGEAYGKLRAMNLGDLAEGLVSAPNMQSAVDKALESLKQIQNPVRRREVAQLLFGSDQWATVATELTPTVRAEIKKLTAAITPEMQAASDAFVGNWQKMQLSVDNFVTQAVGPALPKLNEFIETLNKPVGDGLQKTLSAIADAWERFNAAGGGIKGLDQMLPAFPGWNPNNPGGVEELTPQDRIKQLEARRGHVQRMIDAPAGFSSADRRERAVEETKRLSEEIRKLREKFGPGGATVQQQSFSGGFGPGGLIHNAGFGGGGGAGGSPFSWGFWADLYRGGTGGGDPFRGAGRTYDGVTGVGAGGQASKAPGIAPSASVGTGRALIDYGAAGGPGGTVMGNRDPNNPRAMDPMAPAGSATIPASERATITTASGRKIVVHRAFAENFRGFLADYEKAGGVVGPDSGGVNSRPGNASYHPSGRAIDLNQIGYGIRSRRGVTLPEDVENQIAAKWGLYPGSMFGAVSDRGHFEVRNAAHAAAVLERMKRGQPSGTLPPIDDKPHPFAAIAAGAARRRAEAADADLYGSRRSGDSMMGRAFGAGGLSAGAPKLDASGSVTINLTGGLEKAPARVSMDGLFKNVNVNRKPTVKAAAHSEDI